MKRLLMLSLMVAVLALGSAAQAADSESFVLAALQANESVTWGDYLSGSWAVAANTWWGTEDNSQFLPGPVTTAESAAPGAGAEAGTSVEIVGAIANANTSFGSSAAYAYAQQQRWFMANDGGMLTFDMDFMYSHTLNTGLGETAFADTSAGLALYRWDGTLVDEVSFYDWNFVENGGSLSSGDIDALSVFGEFELGEVGYIWLAVDGQATASIPVPGAILLGALGTGLVGLLRRRVL